MMSASKNANRIAGRERCFCLQFAAKSVIIDGIQDANSDDSSLTTAPKTNIIKNSPVCALLSGLASRTVVNTDRVFYYL